MRWKPWPNGGGCPMAPWSSTSPIARPSSPVACAKRSTSQNANSGPRAKPGLRCAPPTSLACGARPAALCRAGTMCRIRRNQGECPAFVHLANVRRRHEGMWRREKRTVAANEPVRERIRRKLERAMDHLGEDFERVELWAAGLDACSRPVPAYDPPDQGPLTPQAPGQDGAKPASKRPVGRR